MGTSKSSLVSFARISVVLLFSKLDLQLLFANA
jgi:hypothetical protein